MQTKSLLDSNCRQHSQRTLRPAQASKKTNGPQLADFAANNNSHKAVRRCRLAVQVSGGSAGVLAAMKAGADLPTPVPTPPIAFACHCPYPLP